MLFSGSANSTSRTASFSKETIDAENRHVPVGANSTSISAVQMSNDSLVVSPDTDVKLHSDSVAAGTTAAKPDDEYNKLYHRQPSATDLEVRMILHLFTIIAGICNGIGSLKKLPPWYMHLVPSQNKTKNIKYRNTFLVNSFD